MLAQAGADLFFSKLILIVAGGIAPAEATRGQWKQTKSAIAPLTPSAPQLLGLHASWLVPERPIRTVGSLDKHADTVCKCHQLNRAKGSREGDFVPFHSPRFILPCYCSFRSPSLIQPHLRRKKANSSVSTAGRTKQIRISPTQSIGRIAVFVPAAMSFSQPV